MQEQERFLTARQGRERYGNASDMWLYRAEHKPGTTFPKPIRVRPGRRFYLVRRFARMGSNKPHQRRGDQ